MNFISKLSVSRILFLLCIICDTKSISSSLQWDIQEQQLAKIKSLEKTVAIKKIAPFIKEQSWNKINIKDYSLIENKLQSPIKAIVEAN